MMLLIGLDQVFRRHLDAEVHHIVAVIFENNLDEVFANVVDVCGQGIAISTDGIGSKAMIAWMLRKFDTVGIDCVAMNVNDIIQLEYLV